MWQLVRGKECVIPPLMFNVVLDVAMKTAKNTTSGIKWGILGQVGDLQYTDDIRLLRYKHSDMTSIIKLFEETALKAKIKTNGSKTKSMQMNPNVNTPFFINSFPIASTAFPIYVASSIAKEDQALTSLIVCMEY